MGEAKRRREQAEDLGLRIFRCPDLSMWGTVEGLAERSGFPVSDPRVIAASELVQAVWLAADGKECGVILNAMFSLLGPAFAQMADGDPALKIGLARQFAGELLSITAELNKRSDEEWADDVPQRRAKVRPKQ